MDFEVKALVAVVRERPVEKTVYSEYYGPFDTRYKAREFKVPEDGDKIIHTVITNIKVAKP